MVNNPANKNGMLPQRVGVYVAPVIFLSQQSFDLRAGEPSKNSLNSASHVTCTHNGIFSQFLVDHYRAFASCMQQELYFALTVALLLIAPWPRREHVALSSI